MTPRISTRNSSRHLGLIASVAWVGLVACTGRQVKLAVDEAEEDGTAQTSESGESWTSQGSESSESTASESESSDSSSEEGGDCTGEDEFMCPDGTCVDWGGSFIMDPDLCCDYGGDCGQPSCDPGAQECPDGEKCTAYVLTPGYCCVDANKCVPVIGDRQLDDMCTREGDNDDCARGLFCLGESSGSEGPGHCVAFCDINAQTPCVSEWANLPDAHCQVFADAVFPHCVQQCDPLLQDCDDGLGCYAVGSYFQCNVPNPEEDKGNDGDECFYIQSCNPGLICANSDGLPDCESDACCTPFCDCSDPDAPECTTDGEQCECYFEEGQAPPGSENVGLCYQL